MATIIRKHHDLTRKKNLIHNERELTLLCFLKKTTRYSIMKKYTLLFLLILGVPLTLAANCYLVVEGKHSLSREVAEQIALIELSQYIESMSETPPSGIASKDCLYRITLTDLKPGLMLVIKGPNLTSYAESNLEGTVAFQQALFKSIIKEAEDKKPLICKKHAKLLSQECSTPAINSEPVVGKQTVYDPVTGLTWQKNGAGKMNWKAAGEYCQNLELAGDEDWRLPNSKEVESSYAIERLFPERQDYYWSSTPHHEDKYYAWAYTTSSGEVFSDWIENLYYVRCTRGQEMFMAMPIREDELRQESREQNNENDTTGIHWVIAPTYVSGFNQVVEIYNHNIEEQGHKLDEESSGLPVAVVFSPYYQFESGFRIGGRIGPLMYYLGIIDDEDDEYHFAAYPIAVNAGYTFPVGSDDSKSVFIKGGVSKLNARGDFVESEAFGISAAGGMEFMRDRKVSIGFEGGFDIASAKLRKYDCSKSVTPDDLDTCDHESKQIMPIGLTASFLVIF